MRDDYTKEDVDNACAILKGFCFARAYNAGWHTDMTTKEDIDNRARMGERLMLVVTEIAEGMEGWRKGLNDDKLPHREMLRVELIDAAIRIFDTLGAIDHQDGTPDESDTILWEKAEFNANRSDHKLENRLAEGGKKV